MNFKNWLINEINEKTILYYRTAEVFEKGQVVEPYGNYQNDHWLKNQYTEKMLEKFREKYASDKPSRFNCIFCSVVPRSVFLTKGFLYEVKPIGNTHTTMAYYTNEINNVFNNEVPSAIIDKTVGFKDKEKLEKFKWEYNKERLLELFNKYWDTNIDITSWKDDGLDRPLKPFNSKEYKGDNTSNFRKDPKWIEVLCEKVQIVKKIDEIDNIFRKGDRVKFIKDTTILEHSGYDASGNKLLSKEETQRMINDFNGTKSKYGINLNIKKGTKGVIVDALYGQTLPKKFFSRMPFDFTYSKNIYLSLHVKIEGYNFTVGLRPTIMGNLNKIIEKI